MACISGLRHNRRRQPCRVPGVSLAARPRRAPHGHRQYSALRRYDRALRPGHHACNRKAGRPQKGGGPKGSWSKGGAAETSRERYTVVALELTADDLVEGEMPTVISTLGLPRCAA